MWLTYTRYNNTHFCFSIQSRRVAKGIDADMGESVHARNWVSTLSTTGRSKFTWNPRLFRYCTQANGFEYDSYEIDQRTILGSMGVCGRYVAYVWQCMALQSKNVTCLSLLYKGKYNTFGQQILILNLQNINLDFIHGRNRFSFRNLI